MYFKHAFIGFFVCPPQLPKGKNGIIFRVLRGTIAHGLRKYKTFGLLKLLFYTNTEKKE